MVKFKVQAFLLLLLLSPAKESFAQQRLFTNQQHFGVEEGLPQNFISGILQDDDGFIWLATMDGLSRYDGRQFKSFVYNAKDSTGLSANIINNFGRIINNTVTIFYEKNRADDFDLRTCKAKRNNLWEQLRKIPQAEWLTYRITNGTARSHFFMKDQKGIGWINRGTGKINFANRANGLLQQDTISALVESTGGTLYLVSKNGVQVSDSNRRKFTWIPFVTNVKPLTAQELSEGINPRFSIVCIPNNRLVIAEHNKITLIDIDKKNSRIIPPPANLKSGLLPVNCEMQVDSKGQAYFANGGQIFRLTEQGEMKLLWENTINPALRISAFFIDRSDVLWVSINAQGLLKIDLQSAPFESFTYRRNFIGDILEKAGVKIGENLNKFTMSEASYAFRQVTDRLGKKYIFSSWLGPGMICQLEPDGTLIPFKNLIKHGDHMAMLAVPNEGIWLLYWDNTAWYCWDTPSAVPRKRPVSNASLKGTEISDAKFFGGSIWIASNNQGLLQYKGDKLINKFSGPFRNGIMPETLTEFCADPVDTTKFWIGSRGSGLILWDVRKGLQRIYTMEDGLPNNTIYCILPDQAGKLWCSTNKGIFRFDARTGQVNVFEKTDGLPGNEFNRAHKFKFPDGRLAFGGLDGYTIFNPADFYKENKTDEVPLFLTALQINTQLQDARLSHSLIKDPLSTLSIIDLPYDKNYLRFEFAALLFNQPQKIKYRYQLQGADKDWVENGTSNLASYAALRPGNYTLRLNATNNSGLWSAAIREIAVIIHPPFWDTWWAYLLYVLSAALLVRWYFLFRENKLKTEQSLVFEKREAMRLKEIDEVKDRFFSNITHEFRTPLTLIISPLEKLKQDESLPASALRTIKTAQRNSKQLLRLINEFLDFSKLNDGQMHVKLSTGEMALFAADCVRSFEEGAAEKNIKMSLAVIGIEGLYMFDEDKWGKIMTNLISNALKFTPQNGEISILLKALPDDKIRLEVADNGPGIQKAEQPKIFDRFYQVDNSAIRNYGGTGIGLSLVKELTELMQGHVELDSQAGISTRFIVTIPVQKVQRNSNLIAAQMVDAEKKILHEPEAESPLLLIAEDNEELLAFLTESLLSHYRIVTAADGIQAWDMILQELPDIIISDVMMPGQDGFDLCKLCKSDKRTSHIGFILLTSKTAHDARLKGLSSCADDYITKPFHLDELELRTANLLQLQQKTREHLQAQLLPSKPQIEAPEITNLFLIEIYKEIDEKIDDPQLGVEYLCKTMGMSRSTLNRKLKSLLDISPNDLIRQYRLTKATGHLVAGMDISTAAYQVGFSSPSYFSQCFKEQFGITPSEWVSQQI